MTDIRLSRRLLLTAGATALAAPAVLRSARAATTLRLSTSFPNDPKFSTGRIWYDLFLPRLKAATGDQIVVQFFPDNQLGQEADIVNQVKLGVVDAMLTGTSIWSNIIPEWGVLDLGYLFDNFDQLRQAVATPEGKALSDLLVQRAATHFPSWGRNLGVRNFLTKFPFSDPAGLAGKKIRTLPNPIVTETVRLMGASATPMAFGEIYTGLQAGVIDGLEHDAPTILSAKFYETAKYFTLTRHIHTGFGCFISDRTLKRMSPELRDGFLLAVDQATADQWDRAAALELDAIESLKQGGVTVEDCDRTVFRDRVRPLWESFVQKTPGSKPFLDAVLQIQKG